MVLQLKDLECLGYAYVKLRRFGFFAKDGVLYLSSQALYKNVRRHGEYSKDLWDVFDRMKGEKVEEICSRIGNDAYLANYLMSKLGD